MDSTYQSIIMDVIFVLYLSSPLVLLSGQRICCCFKANVDSFPLLLTGERIMTVERRRDEKNVCNLKNSTE